MVGHCCGRPAILAKNQAGIAYLFLLFIVALGSVALLGTSMVWQLEARREKERQLLFVGHEYRSAIAGYYNGSPGTPQYPPRLEDLVRDPRYPTPKRYLRRLYRDPMSEDGSWEVIRQNGRIIGVASRSRQMPIKVADFPPEDKGFEGSTSYADWRFIHERGAATGNGASPRH